MKLLFAFTIAIIFCSAVHAENPGRFIMKLKLPSGQTAVVAEGEFEARSTGSFSVRLYQAARPGDETTFFSAGLIRSRDGSIENAALADIDNDQLPEIIVTIRSAGTGNYISAHAFTFTAKTLIFRGSVESLPPDADPVKALQLSVSRLK